MDFLVNRKGGKVTVQYNLAAGTSVEEAVPLVALSTRETLFTYASRRLHALYDKHQRSGKESEYRDIDKDFNKTYEVVGNQIIDKATKQPVNIKPLNEQKKSGDENG